jgi:hypothetical protein
MKWRNSKLLRSAGVYTKIPPIVKKQFLVLNVRFIEDGQRVKPRVVMPAKRIKKMTHNPSYFDKWQCLTCLGEKEFPDRNMAVVHMELVHGYKPGTPAAKSLVAHFDFARGSWQSNYDWDFGSFKMLQMVGIG